MNSVRNTVILLTFSVNASFDYDQSLHNFITSFGADTITTGIFEQGVPALHA